MKSPQTLGTIYIYIYYTILDSKIEATCLLVSGWFAMLKNLTIIRMGLTFAEFLNSEL